LDKKWVVVPLALLSLVAAIPLGTGTFISIRNRRAGAAYQRSRSPFKLPSMATRARIVTQNLWGRRGAWAERRSVLVAGLRERRPDLVALPESVVNDDYDQVSDVLGPDFCVAHQQAREPGDPDDVEPGQGHSLASRWPLGEVRELDLHLTPRTEGFACGILAAEVLAPEPLGPLLFAFHNPSWKLDQAHERELQAVAAARFLDEFAAGRRGT
jgi:hypothetical protein